MMDIVDNPGRELENLAYDAYWSINKPFERALHKIGEIWLDDPFLLPNKGRSIAILWKNLDARALAEPFMEEFPNNNIMVSTEREDGKHEIRNLDRIRKKLLSIQPPPEVVIILDVVAGSGGTALKIKEEVEKILKKSPIYYFYCVFGSIGLREKMKEKIKPTYVISEYPLDTSVNPSRLLWFLFSDVGDKYEKRSIKETPFPYERNLVKSRLENFFEVAGGQPASYNNQHEKNLIYCTGDFAIVTSPIYLVQDSASQFGFFDAWIQQDTILSLLYIAQETDERIKKYFGDIIKSRGHLYNERILYNKLKTMEK
jgi:hypothetical protein